MVEYKQEQGAAAGAAAEPGAAPAGLSATHPDAGCSDEYVAFAARVGGGRAGIGLRRDESSCEFAAAPRRIALIYDAAGNHHAHI